MVEDFQFKAQKVKLAPGDLLLLYTDGVTESRNSKDEEYGPEHLSEVVTANSDLSARDLIAEIRRDLQLYTEGRPLEDDTTMVAVKVLA